MKPMGKGWIASATRRFGVRFLSAVVLAGLLPFGLVMTLPFLLVTAVSLALMLVAAILFEEPYSTRMPFRLALLILLLAAGWIGIQSLHGLPISWQHPVWAMARDILPELKGTISLAPGDAMLSALTIVFPFSIFLCGLILCDTDERASMLLSLLGTLGGLAAIFGLVQFLMSPGTLIVIDKKSYLDSLTGLFVNRNTAATFYGLSFLINIGRLRDHALKTAWHSRQAGLRDQLTLIALALFAFMALVALMLTRSRAGIAASGLAALVYVPYLVADWKKLSARTRDPRWVPLAWGAAALGLTLAALLLFGAQAILRLKTTGLAEDGRTCILPGLIATSREGGLTGSGFGAFRSAFAPFRNSLCGIDGIFDRAHNGYLEGFIGLGILFPLLLILALASLLLTLLAGWRNRRRMRHVSVLGLAGLLLVLIHAVFDFSLQIPGMAGFFAAFMAAIVSRCLVKVRGEAPALNLSAAAAVSDQGDLL